MVADNDTVIIIADTGSGKTTRESNHHLLATAFRSWRLLAATIIADSLLLLASLKRTG